MTTGMQLLPTATTAMMARAERHLKRSTCLPATCHCYQNKQSVLGLKLKLRFYASNYLKLEPLGTAREASPNWNGSGCGDREGDRDNAADEGIPDHGDDDEVFGQDNH